MTTKTRAAVGVAMLAGVGLVAWGIGGTLTGRSTSLSLEDRSTLIGVAGPQSETMDGFDGSVQRSELARIVRGILRRVERNKEVLGAQMAALEESQGDLVHSEEFRGALAGVATTGDVRSLESKVAVLAGADAALTEAGELLRRKLLGLAADTRAGAVQATHERQRLVARLQRLQGELRAMRTRSESEPPAQERVERSQQGELRSETHAHALTGIPVAPGKSVPVQDLPSRNEPLHSNRDAQTPPAGARVSPPLALGAPPISDSAKSTEGGQRRKISSLRKRSLESFTHRKKAILEEYDSLIDYVRDRLRRGERSARATSGEGDDIEEIERAKQQSSPGRNASTRGSPSL